MYTNGSRFASSSSAKRKLENGGNEDVSGVMPAKQPNYGDHHNSTSRVASYGDLSLNSANSASMTRVALNQNVSSYGEMNAGKHYSSSNPISYEALCAPPPPPPGSYSYAESKVSGQQYSGYSQDAVLGGYQSPPYTTGAGRYGQHHNMMGQGRGWNQRGRPPMRGYQRNQWAPPPPPPGVSPLHPHIGHPGHMVPPLLPPGPYGHVPRGYYGNHHGPRLPPFGHQGNQHGRNQGAQSGSHGKSKHKKRNEEEQKNTPTPSSDVNVIPPKTRGGVLLSPDNKLMKGKKRNAVPPYPSRPWNREDAERALKVEVETTINLKNESLIIRFPDPELSRDIVKSYHPSIANVHFQVPSGPRYCFVQLAPEVNADKVIKMLENVKFGSGHLSVERKSTKQEEEASPESIDPYTLYIGNLPTNVNIQTVKEKFPDAARVDVGFAQRMRYTRYAFIRFNSVDDAIKAYKDNHNLVLDSRSIIVRFRRQKGQIDLPGESKPQQPSKVNVRTSSDAKKKDEENVSCQVKKESKDEEEEEDEKDDDDDEDEEDDEEDNVDDDDDDDDDGEGEAEDDDDDDEEEEEGRKPLQDDDDDDEDDGQVGGPSLPPDDDDEEDDVNIFRELDAQLEGYDEFPFRFN